MRLRRRPIPYTRMQRVRIALNDPPVELPAWIDRHGQARSDQAQFCGCRLRRCSARTARLLFGSSIFPSSTVSLRKVDALPRTKAAIRVTGGLAAGARIVTAGIHSLKPGQQVRIEQDFTP